MPPPKYPTPVVFGTLGLVTLAVVFLLPALLEDSPAGPVFIQHKPECQGDRRTIRHSGGVVLGSGVYEPCLIDTGMPSGEPGLAISRDGTLLRSVSTDPTGIAVSIATTKPAGHAGCCLPGPRTESLTAISIRSLSAISTAHWVYLRLCQ